MTITSSSSQDVWRPVCVGTTGDAFRPSAWASERHARLSDSDSRSQQRSKLRSPGFRQAQFSGDGTTIITQHDDQCLRTFVLPADLLEEQGQPRKLSEYCALPSATPIRAYALHPTFDLQDLSTTVLARAAVDTPIQLVNGLHSDTSHASYPLVNPATEDFVAPHSLAWTADGSRLLAGSKDRISVFDPLYGGQGPMLQHKTAPGKFERKLYGRSNLNGCAGIISALSISNDGILAAGSTQREIALYAHGGSGGCMTSFSVAAQPGESDPTKGAGVMQLVWSPCGRYVIVAERQGDCMQVYDVRQTLNRVSWLTERKAQTTQRLGIDVIPTADGCEIWGGGADGHVRMWKNPGSVEGEHAPELAWEAHSEPVSSAVWHPKGAVLATCANPSSRGYDAAADPDIDSEKDGSSSGAAKTLPSDNTLKVWTL